MTRRSRRSILGGANAKFWGAPGPNLLQDRGGFEYGGTAQLFMADAGDPGAMTLPFGAELPPGWIVNGSPIQWMTGSTTRWSGASVSSPLPPAEGHRFVDLTGNGAGESGSLLTRVPIKLGYKYRLSFQVGAVQSRGDASGPIEIHALIAGYYSDLVLVVVRFRLEFDGGAPLWQTLTQDFLVPVDPRELADEQFVELVKRFRHSAVDPGNAWLQITQWNNTPERAAGGFQPSHFVGLDDVSLRELPLSLLDFAGLIVGTLVRIARLSVLQLVNLLRRP